MLNVWIFEHVRLFNLIVITLEETELTKSRLWCRVYFSKLSWGDQVFLWKPLWWSSVYIRNGSIPLLDVNIWTINNNFYGELPKHLVAIIVGELITLTEWGQQPTFVIIFLKLGHWGWGSWQLFTALLLVNFPPKYPLIGNYEHVFFLNFPVHLYS